MNNDDLALRKKLIGRLDEILKAHNKYKVAKKALFTMVFVIQLRLLVGYMTTWLRDVIPWDNFNSITQLILASVQ